MTSNARVDELMDAITEAQGDGAAVPYSTDPAATMFAPRTDLEAVKPLGVLLSNAIVVLNTAPIHESGFNDAPEIDRLLDRLDIADPVMLVRESDVIELRRLLTTAKAQAEHDAEILKTARKNYGLAMAESRRLDAIVAARANQHSDGESLTC